jgi:hypothetical protein
MSFIPEGESSTATARVMAPKQAGSGLSKLTVPAAEGVNPPL